jgi:hypothetical protein
MPSSNLLIVAVIATIGVYSINRIVAGENGGP